jgi:hypothetical protein
MDDRISELQAEVHGLRIVLAVALQLLPEDRVLAQLTKLEASAKAKNVESATIEVIRSYREIWQK